MRMWLAQMQEEASACSQGDHSVALEENPQN